MVADRVRVLVWRVALVIALVAVAWTSLLPVDDLPQGVMVSDKVMHAAAYAVLGALAVLSGLRWPVAVVSIVLFGLLVEVAQGRSGYRSFEWADLAADSMGAALGAALSTAVARTRRTRDSSIPSH